MDVVTVVRMLSVYLIVTCMRFPSVARALHWESSRSLDKKTKGIQLQISRSRQEVERSIRACREDLVVLNAAAKLANDPAHRDRLLEQSIRHSACLRELERNIASFDGAQAVGSSSFVWVHTVWQHIRGYLGRTQDRDAAVAGLTD